MKFHALLVVRDEADIILQSLRHLLTWADAVYVFDTGSLDETWDIVQEVSVEDARVIPLAKEPVFFSEKRLRGWVFHQARRRMREGDWFVRVDADEFHHVLPPDFVRAHLRKHETVVYHQYYDFCLTRSDVENWQRGGEGLADRARPIKERRRWFTLSSYSEPRLCRYRESMQWPETVSFPHNAGFVAVERLPIRHYPHRDPVQLDRRCRLRSLMMNEPENACNRHWREVDWRAQIKPDDAEGLRYWEAGTELPQPRWTNHLAAWPKRGLQRIVHSRFLPLVDNFRLSYSATARPRRLPDALVQKLSHELGGQTDGNRACELKSA